MSKPHVEIWTDGCALGNPGMSGAGAVLVFGEHQKELSINLGQGTNNTAELLAVIEALQVLKYPCRVTVYSDSQVTVKCAMGEYNRNSNKGLWVKYDLVSAEHDVTLQWIRKDSHPLNKKAHKLASIGARKGQSS